MADSMDKGPPNPPGSAGPESGGAQPGGGPRPSFFGGWIDDIRLVLSFFTRLPVKAPTLNGDLTGALAQAARAHAFLRGRGYVIPEDVRALAPDVLRHRVVLTFEAEAEDTSSDTVIQRVLGAVRAP